MRKKTTDIRTSHMEPTIDPFNFTDLSDLPAELAAKLYSDKTTTSAIWADILVQAKSRGFDSLNINQIEAVARRVGIDVPTAQTIRNHLNAAVALGMISKPTKQTYAVGKKASPKAEAVGLEAVVVTGEVTDMPGEPDPAAVVVDLLASL